MKYLRTVGLFIVFAWFMGGGVMHFVNAEFFLNIMPPWLPYPLALVYISGVFEILGALGILYAGTRAMAGLGLFVLTLVVTPVNVHMWMNPDLFPEVSPAFLSMRLVIQVILLAIIWFSTRKPPLQS